MRFLAILALCLATACQAVSQEEYDALDETLESAKQDAVSATADAQAAQQELIAAKEELAATKLGLEGATQLNATLTRIVMQLRVQIAEWRAKLAAIRDAYTRTR